MEEVKKGRREKGGREQVKKGRGGVRKKIREKVRKGRKRGERRGGGEGGSCMHVISLLQVL